jgi:hypothetical protein
VDDLRGAVDDLRGDMAAHQRVTGAEVTDARNHSMAADLVQRLEREQSGHVAPPPTPPQQTRQERRRERREGRFGAYHIDTAPGDDVAVREASQAELWFLAHAMPRVELLLSKMETGPLGQPSWRDRVLAVMQRKSLVQGMRTAGLHAEAADLDRRFMFELSTLLEESNATFGDWKADKPRLVMVG